jgi:hypothetical protein
MEVAMGLLLWVLVSVSTLTHDEPGGTGGGFRVEKRLTPAEEKVLREVEQLLRGADKQLRLQEEQTKQLEKQLREWHERMEQLFHRFREK